MAVKSTETLEKIQIEIGLLKAFELELLLSKLVKGRMRKEKAGSLGKNVAPDMNRITKRMTSYVNASRVPMAKYNNKRILPPTLEIINQWNHKLRSK